MSWTTTLILPLDRYQEFLQGKGSVVARPYCPKYVPYTASPEKFQVLPKCLKGSKLKGHAVHLAGRCSMGCAGVFHDNSQQRLRRCLESIREAHL